MLTSVIFRCDSITIALNYYTRLFSGSLLSKPLLTSAYSMLLVTMLYISAMLTIEWFCKQENYGIAGTFIKKPRAIRWSFYMFLILSIYYFSFVDKTKTFIYLQF